MKKYLLLIFAVFFIASISAFDWDTNILGYYDFDIQTGNEIPDINNLTGTHNFTVYNGTNWNSSGILNGCMAFNGTTDESGWALMNDSYDFIYNYSISLWVYYNKVNPGDVGDIFSRYDGSGQANMRLISRNNEEDVFGRPLEADTTAHDIFGGAIPVADWHHVVFTANRSHYAIYINRTLKDVATELHNRMRIG